MAMLSRDALLGASDLIEREVELPTIGGSVRVRSLPAAYSNQAMSEALEVVTGARGEQTARVNTGKLESLQVLHALLEPKLTSIEDAQVFSQRCGPAWREVVKVIDEISGIRKEDIEQTQTTFPAGSSSPGREDVDVSNGDRSAGPDLPVRTGA